ncbi:LysR family transcriptional regulator [uncultured Tateyamaria sp.]|uniref:LysR family transcriptional regulator n=1 Tax=uncultured Tateyamaria sp. TaxID=455651 RepID=UPI00260C6EF2|nr:LysR family transcriptional regulator [uncultured Tateyamaria sp.]
MTLSILRSFIEVYRTRSISGAARSLGLTQPAVSQHIAALEAQVGRPLFERHVKGVSPTDVAVDLAAQIGDSLDRAEAALSDVRARSANLSGTVHIAGPSELMTERVAPYLVGLQKSGLALRIQLGGKDDIYELLLSGGVDLAFTASEPEDERLAFQQVAVERLLAVAAPIVAGKITRAADLRAGLAASPLIVYDADAPLVRNWAAAQGVALAGISPAATAPDLRMVRALLMAGAGWSVLPDYLCKTALDAGQLVQFGADLPVPVPVNAINLVWAKSALRHPRIAFAQQSLIKALQD